jgi:ubiquinone/menaquinone biosynthesis C-methylase UbiE
MAWPAYREYILPGRTLREFWDEGKVQAAEIQLLIPENAVVMEYGCGVGRILKNIEAKALIGVDVSWNFLLEAERRGIKVVLTDGVEMNIPDDSIDFVFSIMTFQHCDRDDIPFILGEIRRVLRPDGGALLHFPRSQDYYNPEYVYTPSDVHEIAQSLGGWVDTGELTAYADKSFGGGREWFVCL